MFAVDGAGEVGEGCFCPVLGEFVVVAEVVDRGVGEEGLREVKADAQPAGVHCRLQYGFGGGGA
ncbi:hypothetical protein, partial [Streptomyces sp. CT34]|uniref:hypothetical protein n=1 Tax=Streptomyces sp. CT34 TaxID=1553907 RepID=UPI001F526F78